MGRSPSSDAKRDDTKTICMIKIKITQFLSISLAFCNELITLKFGRQLDYIENEKKMNNVQLKGQYLSDKK